MDARVEEALAQAALSGQKITPSEHVSSRPSPGTQPPETPPQQPPAPEAAKKAERVGQHQVIESGTSRIEVKLDRRTREDVINRLNKRLNTTKSLAERDETRARLSDIERQLLESGGQTMARIQSGEFTEADLALAWSVIYDELLQKTMATGQLIREQPGRFHNLRRFPILNRLSQGSQTVFESLGTKLISDYVKELRLTDIDPERLEQDLVRLNQIRLNLEQSFFGRGFRNPLFDLISTSIDPVGMQENTGIKFHNEILSQRDEISAQRHNVTFLELFQQDRPAALQVLFEANQRALSHFAAKSGEHWLKSEKPSVNKEAIEQQAKKLEERPKPEDITPLREAAEKAKQETESAQEKLSALREQLTAVKRELPEKIRAFNEAHQIVVNLAPSLRGEIRKWTNEEVYYKTQLNKITPPAGLNAREQAQFIKDERQRIGEDLRRVQQNLNDRQQKLREILLNEATAEANRITYERELARLEGTGTTLGEVQRAQHDLDTKVGAQKTADNAVKTKEAEINEGKIPPERKDQADALRAWKRVADHYSQIMNERFSQNPDRRFTRDRLASTVERSNGQLEGTEAIREHIFNLVKTGEYSPELARRMLSDETIARAIIYNYNLDLNAPDAAGITINNLLRNLQTAKNTLALLALDDLNRPIALQEVINRERLLITRTLPSLSGSQVEAAKLVRFLITEGFNSAEDGNSYLDLSRSEFLLQRAPEFRVTPETVLSEGVGRAEIRDHEATWEGDIEEFVLPRIGNVLIPAHLRFRERFGGRRMVNFSVDIRTDVRFLQRLPDRVDMNTVAPEFRIFYDTNGSLRTEIRGRDRIELERLIRQGGFGPAFILPEWITVIDNRTQFDTLPGPGITAAMASDNVLDAVANDIDPNAPRLITASFANFVLERSPQERLRILRGLSVHIPVNNVPITELPPGVPGPARGANYRIDFDNDGNLSITNTATNESRRLDAFYQNRLDTYRQSLGVETLNPEQRRQIQQEFLLIQEALGREILRAQQRR